MSSVSLDALDGSAIGVLLLGAVVVGAAKTAFPSAGTLAVVLFAAALPARASTGALLPLLIAGDLIAVARYRRHVDVAVLLRLVPGVLPGIVLGTWLLGVADDEAVRRTIGALLLALSALQVRQMLADRRGVTPEPPSRRRRVVVGSASGVAAGFTTMTANAAGPVMTGYLLLARLTPLTLLGTTAWFFLSVNLVKVPFSVGLGLIDAPALLLDLALLPALGVGAALGLWAVPRLPREAFEQASVAIGALAAAYLLLAP